VFWGLGLFCIIKSRPENRGERTEDRRCKTEDGFAVGRDSRWVGVFGLVRVGDWGFGGVGRLGEGEDGGDVFGARWGLGFGRILMVVMILCS